MENEDNDKPILEHCCEVKSTSLKQDIFIYSLHVMPEGKHNLHMKFHKEFNSLVEAFLLK